MAKANNNTKKVSDFHTLSLEIKEKLEEFKEGAKTLYNSVNPEANESGVKGILANLHNTTQSLIDQISKSNNVFNLTYYTLNEDQPNTQQIKETIQVDIEKTKKDPTFTKDVMDMAKKTDQKVELTKESYVSMSLADLISEAKGAQKQPKVKKVVTLDKLLKENKQFAKMLIKEARQEGESGFGTTVANIGWTGIDVLATPEENLEKYGFIVTKEPADKYIKDKKTKESQFPTSDEASKRGKKTAYSFQNAAQIKTKEYAIVYSNLKGKYNLAYYSIENVKKLITGYFGSTLEQDQLETINKTLTTIPQLISFTAKSSNQSPLEVVINIFGKGNDVFAYSKESVINRFIHGPIPDEKGKMKGGNKWGLSSKAKVSIPDEEDDEISTEED